MQYGNNHPLQLNLPTCLNTNQKVSYYNLDISIQNCSVQKLKCYNLYDAYVPHGLPAHIYLLPKPWIHP